MGYQNLDILIVDDQPGVRYLLDAVVREEGHQPHLATNGLEAVEMVKKIKPHLVFMDIRMPLMDGTKALEIIRELGFALTVIMMTAFTEKSVIDQACSNGAAKCIIKPFDIDDIRKIIRDTVASENSHSSEI